MHYKRVTTIHANTANLYEKGEAFNKTWVKKSCEIKGGSHEMAVMMLMIIQRNLSIMQCFWALFAIIKRTIY